MSFFFTEDDFPNCKTSYLVIQLFVHLKDLLLILPPLLFRDSDHNGRVIIIHWGLITRLLGDRLIVTQLLCLWYILS